MNIFVYWDHGEGDPNPKSKRFKRFGNAINFARKLNQTHTGYMDITCDTQIGYYDRNGDATDELIAGEGYQLEHIEQMMAKHNEEV
jgi:hypothetical protein